MSESLRRRGIVHCAGGPVSHVHVHSSCHKLLLLIISLKITTGGGVNFRVDLVVLLFWQHETKRCTRQTPDVHTSVAARRELHLFNMITRDLGVPCESSSFQQESPRQSRALLLPTANVRNAEDGRILAQLAHLM